MAVLGVALGAACGGADGTAQAPVVAAVKPSCGDSSTTTLVTVSGDLPARPEIWPSDPARNQLDTTYRAWIGDIELSGVAWHDATELTAVVPAGLAAGTYDLTVLGPFGTTGTRNAAFQVRVGPCPVETAALVVSTAVAAPATATVGQDLTVTATVLNNGQASALGVVASIASAPAGLTLKSGPAGPQDVPAGQARTFTWTFSATAAGSGVFVIDAAGTAADTNLPVAAPRVNTNEVLVNLGAFLSANTVVAPLQATVGQLITVVLTVTNHTTTAVAATPSIVVTGPVTGGNSPAPRSIPGGTSQAFQWTYTAAAPGTASFTASVSGVNPGTGLEETVPTAAANVLVQGQPGLVATLAIPATIELGDFTVTMLVAHSGAAGAADVVEVAPDLPSARPGSTAGVVLVSGPTGAPATVIAGQPAVAFTWVFTATTPGTLSLASTARGRDANSGAAVASAPADSNTARVALHSVGGTVSGLAGTGLVLRNGTESLPIATNGTFAFTTPVASGASYAVTVAAQPAGPSQVCTVANASGTVGAVDVTTVSVTCATSSFTVGGTVAGLVGSGLVLRNGAESLPIAASGPFAFTTPVASGGSYAVTVTAQPANPTQTCTVANGSGTVGAANVTNVSVTCSTSSFTVGGTVSGLAGTGLVLRNGTESLPIAANGTFAFTTPVASGGSYAVTVTAQPTNPSQVCTLANASGTVGAANVTNVSVTCSTSTFTVGGTVSGLSGTGLVLHNGTENLPIASNGTYAFTTLVASGGSYAVTVTAQPANPSQVCTVANGSGTVGAANVTNVNVTCSTSSFTVGGTVSGLAGTGLVLHNGTESLIVPPSATSFVFLTPVASGGSYAVTVTAQPTNPSQVCTVANASGTVGAVDVTTVSVTCATSSFTIGGTVSGLTGTGLTLRNNLGTPLSVAAGATSFVFPTPVVSGGAYSVTVGTQPTNPSQACAVANGTGIVGASNVTTIAVTCTTNTYTIGGRVSGLAVGSTGVTLHNGTDSLTITANGTYVFTAPVASGATYSVTATDPASPSQHCTVANGSGTVGAANVTNVDVTCTTNTFTVGGTVSGLVGTGLELRNDRENLPITSNGPFVFTTPVASGDTYAVTVRSQPTNPSQFCTVSGGDNGLGGGTIGASDVTSVAVTCLP